MGEYQVIMDGGGPWGIRLQGGKDFGVPLNVARVTPGSKASMKGLTAGDQIISINNTETCDLTHMEAQNLIKGAGDTLQLCLKQGQGSVDVGSGGFKAQPAQTLYQTDVNHSAGIDHKYNAKPKEFITSRNQSAGGTTYHSTPLKKFDPAEASDTSSSKKFDPGEYARKKKEELENYKKESKPDTLVDSDVLQMLKKTSITDQKPPAGLQPAVVQHSTDTEDLPPPPPELMMGSNTTGPEVDGEIQPQSHTFKMLQSAVDAGKGDQVLTGLSKQRSPSTTSQPPASVRNVGNTSSNKPSVTVNPVPKAPFPTGPNFRLGKASAPTYRPGGSSVGSKAPPPPAVNAGEIVNPNSRLYQSSAYPSTTSPKTSFSEPSPGRDLGQQQYSNSIPHPPQPRDIPYTPPQPVEPTPPPPGPPQGLPPPQGPPQHASQPGRQQLTNPAGEKKLMCNACNQLMTGPFVSAIGKTWHPEHFCCSSCQVSLQNQAFVEENSKLFCEKCYNQFYAPKCAHCNNAIIGNCVNALGKSWHPDHFICSFCNKSFGNEGFLVDNGRPYCGKCFDDLFSVKCGKCAQPISGGEKYVEALNKNWHSDCFSCNYCSIRLEGNSFYVNRGMPYCHQHKSAVM